MRSHRIPKYVKHASVYHRMMTSTFILHCMHVFLCTYILHHESQILTSCISGCFNVHEMMVEKLMVLC